MGLEAKTITVHCRVSRHNSAQDQLDDALVAHLRERIEHLAANPMYASITPDVE